MYTTENTFRSSNAMFSVSDILFLKEPLPLRMVYDVTAKFADDMIHRLRDRSMREETPYSECVRLWKHMERYERIRDHHTTYEDDPYGYNSYGECNIRYSYK